MTSHERVTAACEFRRPDRIPRLDKFWKFPADWQAALGPMDGLTDIAIWVPREAAFPSRARHIKEEDAWIYEVDDWGRTLRRRADGYFSETLEVPLPPGVDIDRVQFDSPHADARFMMGQPNTAALNAKVAAAKTRHCLVAKTGGPYLRTSFMRGETQFLMDIAGDPPLARAIAGKVGDHITAIGVEAIRRYDLRETGVWIYDDMAYNTGPMFRPQSFEQVLLPAYKRMIAAYKAAGARYVFLHSDGDIRPLLDMLIEAGIDGINPLERRAGMHPAELRAKYPRLVLTGGMDNTDTLINGPIERIQAEAREIIDQGRDGGMVIGSHSVSPEIPLPHFLAYHETCMKYGRYPAVGA